MDFFPLDRVPERREVGSGSPVPAALAGTAPAMLALHCCDARGFVGGQMPEKECENVMIFALLSSAVFCELPLAQSKNGQRFPCLGDFFD